jgi:hypothetical protein
MVDAAEQPDLRGFRAYARAFETVGGQNVFTEKVVGAISLWSISTVFRMAMGLWLEDVLLLELGDSEDDDTPTQTQKGLDLIKNGDPDDAKSALLGICTVWAAIAVLESDPASIARLMKFEDKLEGDQRMIIWDRAAQGDPHLLKLKTLVCDGAKEAFKDSIREVPRTSEEGDKAVHSDKSKKAEVRFVADLQRELKEVKARLEASSSDGVDLAELDQDEEEGEN